MLFITAVPTIYQNTVEDNISHICDNYLNVFFMALSKKFGLFSSRNQGVPRWPTYTWLAKLIMRDSMTSVRVPLLIKTIILKKRN